MKISPDFLNRIKQEEGFSARSFWDDAPGGGGGQWTWGYGTVAPGGGCTITREQAEVELQKEIDEATGDYAAIFQADPPGITQARFDSTVDMLFNLGLTRFSEFHYTIGAIKEGNWLNASAHAQQSIWYREKQVARSRSDRIINEFRTGYDRGVAPPPVVDFAAGATVGKPKEDAAAGILSRLLRSIWELLVVRFGSKNNLRGGGMT